MVLFGVTLVLCLIFCSVISLLSGSSNAYPFKSGSTSSQLSFLFSFFVFFNHPVKSICRRTGENQDAEGEIPVPKEQSNIFARMY